MYRVYIASSMSSEDPIKFLENIRRGIRAGVEVLLEGFAPFVPCLDPQFFLLLREGESISREQICRYSLEWMSCCHAVLVLPNSENSRGTQEEIKIAKELVIPVLYSIEELIKFFKYKDK